MVAALRDMVLPDDVYDQELLSHVHPHNWVNPTPHGKYNLVVLGGGTAGLVSAGGTGGLGGKVALIEKALLGGDCLNVGCVPSKGVIRAARAVYDVMNGAEFGVKLNEIPQLSFAKAMERMRRLRAEIAPHDSAQRFTEEFKVDVFIGAGKFISANEIEVAGQRLQVDRAGFWGGFDFSVSFESSRVAGNYRRSYFCDPHRPQSHRRSGKY